LKLQAIAKETVMPNHYVMICGKKVALRRGYSIEFKESKLMRQCRYGKILTGEVMSIRNAVEVEEFSSRKRFIIPKREGFIVSCLPKHLDSFRRVAERSKPAQLRLAEQIQKTKKEKRTMATVKNPKVTVKSDAKKDPKAPEVASIEKLLKNVPTAAKAADVKKAEVAVKPQPKVTEKAEKKAAGPKNKPFKTEKKGNETHEHFKLWEDRAARYWELWHQGRNVKASKVNETDYVVSILPGAREERTKPVKKAAKPQAKKETKPAPKTAAKPMPTQAAAHA